ncbi:hypothetical protein AAG593_09420 [Citromicrobium bathyomarinum]
MSGRIEPLRQDLRKRGLLGSDNRLTAAGNVHAAQLIEDLRIVEAPSDPAAPRVRWNHHFGQRRR